MIGKQIQRLGVFVGAKEKCVRRAGSGDDSAHAPDWPLKQSLQLSDCHGLMELVLKMSLPQVTLFQDHVTVGRYDSLACRNR